MLLALLLAAAPTEPAQVTLESVYARPEFAGSRHRSGVTLKVLLARVQAWVESLFETSGAQAYSNVTRVLVLLAAVLAAVWVAMRLRGRRAKAVQQRAPRATHALVLDAPSVHLQRARALLETDARESIREALFALLSSLEQRRYARPDRVKTNRELANELPDHQAPAALVVSVTRMLTWYDEAFYSREPVPRSEAARFIEAVSAL